MTCEYLQDGDRWVCVLCGDVRPKKVRRNCPKVTRPARPDIPSMLYLVAGVCIHCPLFPCLGPTDCKHEKALRAGRECPLKKWFYV